MIHSKATILWVTASILSFSSVLQAQQNQSLTLSLNEQDVRASLQYRSINFSTRLSSEQCGEVLRQITELGINRTEDENLNQILDSVGVECGLSDKEVKIQFKPVLYKFQMSDLKFLWDGSSLSVNDKAQMTSDLITPKSFNNVVQLSQDQIYDKKSSAGSTFKLGILDRLTQKMSEVTKDLVMIVRDGKPHLILSGIAHHGRGTYTRERINNLNENAWGIGFESVKINTNGNREAVAAMIIRDSHFDPQLSVSYEWQKGIQIINDIKLWGGFSAGLVVRSDYDYLPIPFVLPTFGISVGKLDIKSVYIPNLGGGTNSGSVLFIFASIPFKN